MQLNSCYLTIKEASLWATNYLGKEVTTSNISYLIQYGRIRKIGHNGSTQILKSELKKYYCAINKSRESFWKDKLRWDLNWKLSFDNLSMVLSKKNKSFADILNKQKISGIFSSPPYVGLIDYHEQHAYAYDLFSFKRKDEIIFI
ncbi:hypothetical protein AGMMS50222_02780 [Endomicrobiia bacterium]|nr:hypothetical protein AGMMS49531_09550 [Endomicrobiia bacterium]GHT65946.1 hypothetical protein AGMMS49556_06410 [Endomicrobiia bacterium]GHT70389.1 hypothetical protein AGMMS49950_05300 [Endomicrobiia bacterium]GHT74137.1 hypothetical protein AGMMS50222_02780 [Endomicrobiia bacterium]